MTVPSSRREIRLYRKTRTTKAVSSTIGCARNPGCAACQLRTPVAITSASRLPASREGDAEVGKLFPSANALPFRDSHAAGPVRRRGPPAGARSRRPRPALQQRGTRRVDSRLLRALGFRAGHRRRRLGRRPAGRRDPPAGVAIRRAADRRTGRLGGRGLPQAPRRDPARRARDRLRSSPRDSTGSTCSSSRATGR